MENEDDSEDNVTYANFDCMKNERYATILIKYCDKCKHYHFNSDAEVLLISPDSHCRRHWENAFFNATMHCK